MWVTWHEVFKVFQHFWTTKVKVTVTWRVSSFAQCHPDFEWCCFGLASQAFSSTAPVAKPIIGLFHVAISDQSPRWQITTKAFCCCHHLCIYGWLTVWFFTVAKVDKYQKPPCHDDGNPSFSSTCPMCSRTRPAYILRSMFSLLFLPLLQLYHKSAAMKIIRKQKNPVINEKN